MNNHGFRAIFGLLVLLWVSSIGWAMPLLTGNVLSWPDDGWYEVQRADTYETVCEGIDSAYSSVSGGPCVIDGGSVIVINHTSGERFENITADDSPAQVSHVAVENSAINWPDDGWYQVQDADTFATVCEGGNGCDVEAGRYVVINHTTGERFEDIVVGSAAQPGSSQVAEISVSGQQLSWPADGWYQVQDASTYATVCEGGTSCSVEPGTYVVINHSTGRRFTDIEVTAVGDTSIGTSPSIPTRVIVEGDEIRWPDDGWYQVQNAQTFETVCEGGLQCLVSPGNYFVINHSSGQRQEIEVTGNTSPTNPAEQEATQVNFDITVPAYMSDELQVRLQWGDLDLNASWVADESWVASASLPVQTQNQLVVSFNDRNGALTLGTVETQFMTGASPSQSFTVTAGQFDTNRWDFDADGISNLDEVIAGSDPLEAGDSDPEPSQPAVQATLELVTDKIFRLGWQASDGAETYRILENQDGLSGFTQISSDLEASTRQFDHRVALYDRVNASYIVQACNDSGCIDSAELQVTGSLENAVGYFKSSNPDAGDRFGSAISLSGDGSTLVIGAVEESSAAVGINGDQVNNSEDESGAVYVFDRSTGSWQQQAYLKASGIEGELYFGSAVSLSADGNTLAVVANGGTWYANTFLGRGGRSGVFVFARSNGEWQQQELLDLGFVWSIDLAANGNMLAVGSPSGDGLVTLFERINGQWQLQSRLTPNRYNNYEQGVRFGSSVALNANGDTVAVGAFNDNSAGTRGGSAYVFARVDGNWQEQAYLNGASNFISGLFGFAVSLSAGGDTLAIGASRESSTAVSINGDQDNYGASNSGAVFVFTRSNGEWQRQAYLKASNTGSYDLFGTSVSLSADGTTLAVGAPDEESAAVGINGNQDNSGVKAGAVYLFRFVDGNWRQQSYIKASNTDTSAAVSNEQGVDISRHEDFGTSVSLSSDGQTLAVGASGEDSAATGVNGDQGNNSSPVSGAVYLY